MGGGLGRETERGRERETGNGSVWAGAPVPPLPQLPIEEHGRGSWRGLFIPSAGSRYSCGTRPGCGRLKRVEKSNMLALRCQMVGQEKRGLNQITLVTLAQPPSVYLLAMAKER